METQKLASISTKTLLFKRNELVVVVGQTDTNVYYVEQGSLRVFVTDLNGEEHIIRFGYPTNVLIVLDSFFAVKPTTLNIQTLKKTVLKVIPKSRLQLFVKENSLAHSWERILQELLIQQMEREVDLLISSPKERYERVLRRSPQLFQEIPNKYIANYLRMSPETLSRLKKS